MGLHFRVVHFQEFLKLTVDLVDLVGLYFVIQRVSGKSAVKVLNNVMVNKMCRLFDSPRWILIFPNELAAKYRAQWFFRGGTKMHRNSDRSQKMC